MSAKIKQRKEKGRLLVGMSNDELLKTLNICAPKHKQKVLTEIRKRGIESQIAQIAQAA